MDEDNQNGFYGITIKENKAEPSAVEKFMEVFGGGSISDTGHNDKRINHHVLKDGRKVYNV